MIMSMQASVMTSRDLAAPRNTSGTATGAFGRWFQSFIAAQERAAHARAARELRHLSDPHLAALGLSPTQIAGLRETGRLR